MTLIPMIYSKEYVTTNPSSAISLFFYTYCINIHHVHILQSISLIFLTTSKRDSCTLVCRNAQEQKDSVSKKCDSIVYGRIVTVQGNCTFGPVLLVMQFLITDIGTSTGTEYHDRKHSV